MRRRVILTELERLNHKGVLDDESLRGIKEYYRYERETTKSFSAYLTITGLVMVSFGVILLFAYNWWQLTRGVKTGLILGILITSQIVFGVSIWKRKEWLTGAGVFNFAMSGVAVAAISQMYNISGSDTSYFFMWSLLTLPIVYLTRSNLIGLLYSAIVFLFLRSDGNIILYFILLAGMLCIKKDEGRYGAFTGALTKIVALSGLVYWYEGLALGGRYSLMFYGGLISLTYLWPVGLRWISEMGILVMIYMLTHRGGYYSGAGMEWGAKMLLGGAVYLSAAASVIYKKQWKNPLNYHLVLIPITTFFSFGYVFYNIYVFLLGLFYAFGGIKINDIKLFNKGSILMALILLTRFLDHNISTLIRGVVFIVVGVSLILGNLYLSRRKS